MNRHFPGYFWIYFVGPLLGSLLASAFFKLLNGMRYQTCNPGQDFSDEEELQESGIVDGDNGGVSPPLKHERNVSGATAVDHTEAVGGQGIPVRNDHYANTELRQDGISPTGNSTYTNPAYNGNAPVEPTYTVREYVEK